MPLPPGDVSTLARRFQRHGPPLRRMELEQDQPYIRSSDHPCHLPPSSSRKTLTLREHLSRPPSSPCEGILPPAIPNRFPVSFCHHLPLHVALNLFRAGSSQSLDLDRHPSPRRDHSRSASGNRSGSKALRITALAWRVKACLQFSRFRRWLMETEHGRAIRDLPGGTSSDRLRHHG